MLSSTHNQITTTQAALLAALLLLATTLGACAFTSMHNPRPNEPGEVTVGVNGSGVFVNDEVNPIFSGALRVGVAEGSEVGLNAGTLGADLAYKYGFMESANPLQVSLIGGVDLFAWSILGINIGALVGYEIADIVMPFAGYRQHLLIGGGVLPAYHGVGGLEFFLGEVFSIMLEVDYTTSSVSTDSEDADDIISDIQGITVFSLGLNFNFGGED